jgi:sulfur-carrier protein adenylyltransferase/sulfurtransferase
VVVLDVREESEHETVNLGGTLIPLAQLPDRLDELDRDATVLVHCRAGSRGGKAVVLLREAGFDDAWNVNGALVAWADRIDPSTLRY